MIYALYSKITTFKLLIEQIQNLLEIANSHQNMVTALGFKLSFLNSDFLVDSLRAKLIFRADSKIGCIVRVKVMLQHRLLTL